MNSGRLRGRQVSSKVTYKDVDGGKILVGEKVREPIKCSAKSDRLPDRVKKVNLNI
jgi:hypothetical protein